GAGRGLRQCLQQPGAGDARLHPAAGQGRTGQGRHAEGRRLRPSTPTATRANARPRRAFRFSGMPVALPHAMLPRMPILQVRAKPNSRESSLVRQDDGTWLARLKSPPVDGKANAELVALVAREFGCAKSAVSIKTGAGSKLKRVVVPD